MSEPDYYAGNGLSPLSAFKQGLLSEEEYIGFLKGNIIKYVVRAGKKDDATKDMNKCIDYCHHLQRYYVENNNTSSLSDMLQGVKESGK